MGVWLSGSVTDWGPGYGEPLFRLTEAMLGSGSPMTPKGIWCVKKVEGFILTGVNTYFKIMLLTKISVSLTVHLSLLVHRNKEVLLKFGLSHSYFNHVQPTGVRVVFFYYFLR